MVYVLAYKLANGTKALAYGNEGIVAAETLEQAKKLIPNWNGYHVAGVTWSASATLYWIAFHPHIVGFNDLEEIKAILAKDEKQEHQIYTERAIGGSARYIKVLDNYEFNVIFDPKLIDEGIETAKPFWEKE